MFSQVWSPLSAIPELKEIRLFVYSWLDSVYFIYPSYGLTEEMVEQLLQQNYSIKKEF